MDSRRGMRVCLIDFGCSRFTGAVGFQTVLVGPLGISMMTPHYAAPEVKQAVLEGTVISPSLLQQQEQQQVQQQQEQPSLSLKADMYSFGLIAFEVLLVLQLSPSSPAFNATLRTQLLTRVLSVVSRDTRLVERIVSNLNNCLHPDASQRPAASLMRTDLELLIGSAGVLTVSAAELSFLAPPTSVRASLVSFITRCINFTVGSTNSTGDRLASRNTRSCMR